MAEPSRIRHFLGSLGPGIVAGAADDDPSGIATYSIAGAQFGTSLLWISLITWPFMAAVQMMCARIGMVTGRGLAASLRQKTPRPVVAAIAIALLAANTINIGADFAGMADAAEMLTHIDSHLWVLAFGIGIGIATVRLRYAQIANVLKWLALSLLAYAIAAFDLHPRWGELLRDLFIPSMPARAEWPTVVAILGTTISPYLFFWQASQEVEEEKAGGRLTLGQRRGATPNEILTRKFDVGIGTFFSNAVMFFVIATTALTLNRAGLTHIQTSREAAEALRPLAGDFCTLLYSIGIIAVGVLAIPTLAGSAAYALAETFGWRQGLDQRLLKARAFYAVVLVSIAIGVSFDFLNVSPMAALFYSAVINGVLAPVLLLAIFIIASDRKLMQKQPSSIVGRAAVAITAIGMAIAAVAMFVL